MISLKQALFAPASVALVGASNNPKKNTARPQRYLRKHGYQGRIFPINLNHREVLGETAYRSITEVPYPIEHAYIMVPAAAIPAALEDCAKANIPIATIFSDGFAEAGAEGIKRQQQIVEIARNNGIRILGPNSIGVINTHQALTLSVVAVLELPEIHRGSISMVSQSGSLLGVLLSRGQARGVNFAKLVSVGNEADISVGEIVEMLVDDAETKTIVLFLETIRDAEQLAAAAHRAHAAGKPVIVYKLGRSEVGQALAVSHTGAITGDDAVADAFFRQHGLVRVDMLETMFELPALLAHRKTLLSAPTKSKSKSQSQSQKVALLTTTGGGAALVADRLGSYGIELIPAPQNLAKKLADFGIHVGNAPIIDLTLAGARKEVYSSALTELLQTPDCDAVVAVVGSSGQFHPELAIEPILSVDKSNKPLAVFIVPQADKSLELLNEAGIAAFRTPEACADGVRALLQAREPASISVPPEAKITALIKEYLPDNTEPVTLDEQQSRQIFSALAINQAQAQIIQNPDEACDIGFPLAAKILSADIPHKTEAGGVVLNINDAAELTSACRRIFDNVARYNASANVQGILLQRMQSGLAEALIGYRRSEPGPTITLGAGGTLAEIYRDFALRMAPVTLADAYQMIEEVKGLAVIRGYRSLPRGDSEALAQAVCALSRLAAYSEISEAEINPMIIKAEGEGVVAVDGLIVLKR